MTRMRLGQIVVLVVGIVALVFVVSFAAQYVRRGSKDNTAKVSDEVMLTFPITNAGKAGPLGEEEKSLPFEWRVEGYYDFWFTNERKEPVVFGVSRKNCTCSSVKVCLAPEGVKDLSAEERAKRAQDSDLEWTSLETDHQSVTVPPGAGGWVRLGWKTEKLGNQRMAAQLWFTSPDRGATKPLEVPVALIEPVRVLASGGGGNAEASVNRLNSGDTATASFLLWSSTRPKFTIKPPDKSPHPCISYGPVEPLNAEEIAAISKKTGLPVLCGYQTTVTLKERVDDDHHLDLGPFRRRITWTTDVTDDPVVGYIAGEVRNEEITVATRGAKPGFPPRVELNVTADHQGKEDFTVEVKAPDLELKPDAARTADFLKVAMERLPGGGSVKEWRVTVRFRPESGFRGRFPDRERPGYESTAIYVNVYRKGESSKTAGKPWRTIRVPVEGFVPF